MDGLHRVRPGATLYFFFESFQGSSGANITASNFALSDIAVYKNGSTTERANTSGFALLDTDGIDFDGKTGIHGFSIDLSDNTDDGFWQAGARYNVVVGPITVDSQSLTFKSGWFVIGHESAIRDTTIATLASQVSFTLAAGPANDNALKWCRVVVTNKTAANLATGLVSAYTGSTKTVTLAFDPGAYTMAAGDNISILPPDYSNVCYLAGTAQTAGDLGALAAAIKAKTDLLPTSPAAVGSAMTLAANAVDSNALATNAADEIATSVWGFAGVRSLNDFGTLVADMASAVWSFGTRTLTAIADSSGVTTLLSRLTSTRASLMDNLANLDATVSSRSVLTADQVATRLGVATNNLDTQISALNALSVAIKAKTDLVPADPAETSDVTAAQAAILAAVGDLDTAIGAVSAVTDRLNGLIEVGVSGDQFTEYALSNGPGGSGVATILPTTMPLGTRRSGTIRFGLNATLPAREEFLLQGDGNRLDMSGVSEVVYRLRAVDGGDVLVQSAATVADPVAAKVRYAWQPGDLSARGVYREEWVLTLLTGTEIVEGPLIAVE